MADLRQSTSQIIRFGPFLDSTDGVTPETALTIAQADMQLSKDGAAFAQKNTTGNATHDVDGWYSTTLDATDTATATILEFQVTVAGALPYFKTYNVLTATAYDAFYTGTFNNLGGVAQTVDNNTILATLPLATDIVSAGAITTLAGAVVNVDLVDTLTTYTSNTPQTADHTAAIADIPTVSEFNARTRLDADYFSWATDTVANVTTVATTTTNTDMRGTDGANVVAPDNASITNILADTNELQLNQGNWVTATGFATTAEIATAQADLDIITGATGVNLLTATQASIDAILVDTGTTIPATLAVHTTWIDAILTDTSTTIPNQISSLENISYSGILASGDVDGYSIEETLKLLGAASYGTLSGAATTTVTITAPDASKARLTATVDADGNRSAVTKDATG